MSHNELSHEQVDRLLERLSTDDDFREQFLGDPAAALASLGVTLDHRVIPGVRRLPSKADIRAQREALHRKLVGQVGLPIFFFR